MNIKLDGSVLNDGYIFASLDAHTYCLIGEALDFFNIYDGCAFE
jgi:hypothetical protein